MHNAHELQISRAFDETKQQLAAALEGLAYMRSRVSEAKELSSSRAARVPEIKRHLSIAITEAENASLRLQEAVAAFARNDDAR